MMSSLRSCDDPYLVLKTSSGESFCNRIGEHFIVFLHGDVIVLRGDVIIHVMVSLEKQDGMRSA